MPRSISAYSRISVRLLQIRHFAPPVRLCLEEPLECRKPLRDPFRVVQAIDPDDERTASQALDHPLNVGQPRCTLGKMGKGRGFDADREHVDPNRPLGDDEIEIVAVKAALPREVAAQIEGVIAGLEAHKIASLSEKAPAGTHSAVASDAPPCAAHFARNKLAE